MSRQRSAIVIRTTAMNGGGWAAVIKPEGKEKAFVTVSENHPKGTRLVLREGEWTKP